MRVLQISAALAVWLGTTSAFYPYIMEGHKGARHKKHTSDQISRAFNFKEGDVDADGGLVKMNLRRRAISRRSNKLVKRVNDFKIAKAEDTSITNSAPIDQDGTDFSYFTEVHLGNDPGETVYLLLDTGSSSMWVMGTECTTKACTTHSRFGTEDSKTYNDTGRTFDIGYNTGEVTGDIVTDTVTFAGISIEKQFGVAKTTSDDFDDYPMDGILGLGRSSAGSGLNAPTFMETVVQEKDLKSNTFGISLSRSTDEANDGSIVFGGVDESKFTGDINYVDTTGDIRDWRIPVSNIQIDGQDVGVASGRTAIIDTGTTYSFIATDDAKAMYAKIDGATEANNGVYHVPCDTTISIAFVFNDTPYEISPKDYVGKEVGDGQCYTHIIAQNVVDDEGTWLLGGTFLKNVYSVFDVDKNRVGFAKRAYDSEGASESSAPPPTSVSSTSVDPSSTTTGTEEPASTTANSTSDSSDSSEASKSTSPSEDLEPSGLARPTLAADTTASPAAEPNEADSEEGAASSIKAPGLLLILGAITAFML